MINERGKPVRIRVDNGSEFTSHELTTWAEENSICIQYTQPGKVQNGFIERFNRLYREAVLDAYLFFELYEVRQSTTEWMEEYNLRRQHEALDNLTPVEYKNRADEKKKYQLTTV